VARFAVVYVAEAAEHGVRSGRGSAFDGGKKPLSARVVDAIQYVQEREAIETGRRVVFKKARRIRVHEPNLFTPKRGP